MRDLILFVSLLFLFLSCHSSAQWCDTHFSCEECLQDGSCQWCGESDCLHNSTSCSDNSTGLLDPIECCAQQTTIISDVCEISGHPRIPFLCNIWNSPAQWDNTSLWLPYLWGTECEQAFEKDGDECLHWIQRAYCVQACSPDCNQCEGEDFPGCIEASLIAHCLRSFECLLEHENNATEGEMIGEMSGYDCKFNGLKGEKEEQCRCGGSSCEECASLSENCIWCKHKEVSFCMEGVQTTFGIVTNGPDFCDEWYWKQCGVHGEALATEYTYILLIGSLISLFVCLCCILILLLVCCVKGCLGRSHKDYQTYY